MPVPAEFFCLRCQRCIRDASQLRPHFRECPQADIQRIAYTPPPWQRRTYDVNQFRDLSDSSYTSFVSSSETRDNVIRPLNRTQPMDRFVDRSAARVSTPAESVNSLELENLVDQALFIPGRRKKITLGIGVRALITGKPLRRQNLHGILVTNSLWVGGELHEDVGVAGTIRPTRDMLSYFSM